MRAIGRSVPSSECRTRKRCWRSPNTICEVRVAAPFSFSLCCTRSERRIVLATPALSRTRSGIVPKTAPISRVRPMLTHLLLGQSDYVPRVVWGKVTNVLCVPEVQPPLHLVGLAARLVCALRGSAKLKRTPTTCAYYLRTNAHVRI